MATFKCAQCCQVVTDDRGAAVRSICPAWLDTTPKQLFYFTSVTKFNPLHIPLDPLVELVMEVK